MSPLSSDSRVTERALSLKQTLTVKQKRKVEAILLRNLKDTKRTTGTPASVSVCREANVFVFVRSARFARSLQAGEPDAKP